MALKEKKARRRPVAELTRLEQVYLLLQRSAMARAAGLVLLSIPAVLVLGLFWWSVGQDREAQRSASAGLTASARADQAGESLIGGANSFMPEFDRQDGIILGCNELAEFHPQVMIDMLRAMRGKVEVYGLVHDAAQRQKVISLLEQNQLPANAMQFLELPAWGMWVRDFGPKFLRNKIGGLTTVDFAYLDRPATDGTIRPNDDKIPQRLAELFRTTVLSVPLSMEGGNLLTNGYGICVSTTQIVEENSHRNYGLQNVAQILRDYFGQVQWTYLDHLPPDGTRHIDTYAMFTAPDTIVVASCDPAQDAASAAMLDKAAAQLAQVPFHGKPLRVVRIPMALKGDGVMRTYTNVVFANGTLLVPQYADVDAALNEQALRIYRETMPGWEVVGIQCLSVAQKGGSLHCITCNVPSPSMAPLELPTK